MIKVESFGLPELEAALAALSHSLRFADRHDLLDDVGATLAENVRLGFHGSVDPYGTPWHPLVARKGQPLRDTGRLMNSITHRVTAQAVEVGTNVEYAEFHQRGVLAHGARFISGKRGVKAKGDGIPARPFLPNAAAGLPAEWEAEILRLATARLSVLFGTGGRR